MKASASSELLQTIQEALRERHTWRSRSRGEWRRVSFPTSWAGSVPTHWLRASARLYNSWLRANPWSK